MQADELRRIAALIRGQRWAALATISSVTAGPITADRGAPFASMVAYVPEPGFAGLLLHLSRLAPHTRNLLADPRAALVISEPDMGQGDPQTLARITLTGTVTELPRDSEAYEAARELYLKRLPDAEQLFGFGDFMLFRLTLEEGRYVGGFARAYTLNRAQLRAAADMEPA